ncbi:MAG: response regulator [Magnetococcales bacterium]|nr:response regulator [Magnetococcales bacterium]
MNVSWVSLPFANNRTLHWSAPSRPARRSLSMVGVAVLFLLFLVAPPRSYADNTLHPILLTPLLDGLSATRHIRILEDPSRSMTLADILEPNTIKWFQPIGSISSRGISSSAWWVVLEVHNPSAQTIQWLLHAFHPLIDYLDIHHIREGKHIESWQLGDHRPWQNRPIAFETPIVPLATPAQEKSLLVLRYAFAEGGAIDTELLLWDQDSFASHRDRYGILLGCYLGTLAFIIVYNLFIFISTRLREYFWYVLYLTVFLISGWAMSGAGHRYFYANSLWMTDHFPTMMTQIAVILGPQFTRIFLDLPRKAPLLNRLTLLFMALMPMAILLSLSEWRAQGLQLTFYISFFLFLLILCSSLWLLWQKDRKAIFASIAWSVFLAGAITNWSRYMGYLPTSLLTLWSGRIGSVLEAALLSLALADHINQLRREKELAIQRERETILRTNSELEHKVQERTLDLQAKNAELAKGRELLRATLESTHDGILAVGCDGTITHSNHHFMQLFHFPADTTLPGNPGLWNQLINGQLTQQHLFANKLAPSYQPSGDDHTLLPCKDGRLIECYSLPLLQQGARIGRVWNFADITQQKQYETQLLQARQEAEAANRSKSIFLASMSHEIRTPLNGILGMAELLVDLELPDNGREYSLAILSSGRSLLHIINDLLDYSKIEAEKLQLEHIPFNLPVLLQDIATLFRQLAAKNKLQFFLQQDPALPTWILGDPTRLRQILVNLLANAIKFTPQGEITLRAQPLLLSGMPSQLICEVRDTGIGIAADQFDRIFRSYEQAETSTTRQYGGTGLGLAITQQLTQLMGGHIEVESQLQSGSTFRLVLPCQLCEPPVLLSSTEENSNTPLPFSRNAHILVVEDDPINRAVLQGMLKRWPLEISFAHDGQQAIEHLAQNRYDLVFMDCQMPVMDGYTVCRHLRNMEESLERHTPVVALTAFAMRDDREKCLAAGMDDYLAKPVSWREIRSALQRWLPTSP